MRSWMLPVGLSVVASVLVLPAVQAPRPWEDPRVFEQGQESPHATLMPYATRGQALRLARKQSPYCLLLNGQWRFHWAPIPEESPAGFHRPAFDDSGWDLVTVPGNWQMQGYDWPKFRNIAHPFAAKPPLPPSDFNPVGCYRRRFELPPHWEGRQVFLHFEGVKSAAEVWVNGRRVGYSEGGMEPAEYNLTPLLQAGPNLLAVKVWRNSDGTYLEDQDMWRLSGIFRDVYLMATPEVHIRDFAVVTDLDAEYRDAELRVQAALRNYGSRARQGRLRVGLDWQGELQISPEELSFNLQPGQEDLLVFSRTVRAPRQWSAEKPHLYTLLLELLDEQGAVTEVLSRRIGFREVEIRDQQVLVNGVPVKFNGVNSHMHHPETGNAVDGETLRRDLVLMKRFNINLVRTSHYPPPPEYLELADELGMYIIDETGDEAHATEYLSEDPEWRDAYVNRARKMVLRDRNHPSVIIWSAGNESGSGDNICAVIEEGKRLDPSRPGWMYGGNNDYLGDDPNAFRPTRCEDIVGPRYPTPRTLEEVVAKVPAAQDPRPSFMDEYLAASGNALGGLDEFWNLIRRHPRLSGGAVWDWVSPGIRWPVRLTPDAAVAGEAADPAGRGRRWAALLGRARLVTGRFGDAVYLSGHDEWVELYRRPELDEQQAELTLDLWIYPYPWNGHGWYLNKGEQGWGLIQRDAETVEFYVNGEDGGRVRAPLPPDWTGRWHRLTGVLGRGELLLYIDGTPAARRHFRGLTGRTAFPVNLGRQADLVGQEHAGYLSHAVLDAVRVWDRALSDDELADPGSLDPAGALVWLDFEEEVEAGSFFWLGIGARSYGLVWPDRTPQPELWQLKKSPQPVRMEAVDIAAGRIRITNLHHFTNLSELQAVWEVHSNGEAVESATLDVELPPQQSLELTVPFRRAPTGPGNLSAAASGSPTRYLTLSFRLRTATPWAEAGHEIAWEQFALPEAPTVGTTPMRPVSWRDEGERLVVSGDDFVHIFDRRAGELVSMQVQGRELLRRGPRFNVWRAPVANEFERAWGEPRMAEEWFAAGLDRLVREVTAVETSEKEHMVRVRARYRSPVSDLAFEVLHVYRFAGDGSVRLLQRMTPLGAQPRWLPKVGLELEVSGGLDQIRWFGRGPFETYPDRKTGAKLGVWSDTVDGWYSPYLIPQDYGNHTDVLWIRLFSEEGYGLEASGSLPLNASARRYTTDHLTRAEYPFQLVPSEGIVLSLDQAVTGVGCTAIKTLEAYRVIPAEMEFEVTLRPVTPR